MPVKRALRMENQTPAKRPAPDRNYSPMTGTAVLPAAGHVEAKESPAKTHKPQVPQTEAQKKLRALRSKLEGSMEAFIKARQELEEIVSAEGSSELKSFFMRGSADLKTELKRHRELVSKADSCIHLKVAHQNQKQGVDRTVGSYEFLKSLMG